MKYYVVVELRDYNDKEIAYSSCNCGDNISDDSIINAVRVAGELMLHHHTGIKMERLRPR